MTGPLPSQSTTVDLTVPAGPDSDAATVTCSSACHRGRCPCAGDRVHGGRSSCLLLWPLEPVTRGGSAQVCLHMQMFVCLCPLPCWLEIARTQHERSASLPLDTTRSRVGLNFKTVVNRDGFNKQVHKCRLVMARRLVAVRCAARGDRTDFGWRGQFQQHCDATLLFKHGVSDTSLALLRAGQFHGRIPVQRLPRISCSKLFCVNVSKSAVRKNSNGEAPRHVGSWVDGSQWN